ncbi:MAG: Protein-glutamate methylesterase/protein-glutamine glutaminase [Bacteroidota bacterium]|nr:Protein-glutamate methylesterase/protein-glutamine glutaminase [Bacteroidota bacterium]
MIKLLIVDDSIFIRTTLKKILKHPEIEIVDTAPNGKIGVERVIELQPDVVTMDIEMPVMNGIEALREIMDKNPVPVIMVSTLTKEGADVTLEALTLGAVDFITKRAAFDEAQGMKEELLSKILAIGHNPVLRNRFKAELQRKKSGCRTESQSVAQRVAEIIGKKRGLELSGAKHIPLSNEIEAIGIGISTGGPNALQVLFRKLPADIPVPILIAQHMPPFFTKSLAERLDKLSQISVKEAQDGDRLERGKAYIAPGGRQMTVNKRRKISISDEPANSLYKPCVNVLLDSMIDVFDNRMVGIIMTGMGHDGQTALKRLHDRKGYVIAQDLDSCVVGGMPKSVMDVNAADDIQSLEDLPQAIASLFGLNEV